MPKDNSFFGEQGNKMRETGLEARFPQSAYITLFGLWNDLNVLDFKEFWKANS